MIHYPCPPSLNSPRVSGDDDGWNGAVAVGVGVLATELHLPPVVVVGHVSSRAAVVVNDGRTHLTRNSDDILISLAFSMLW